MFNITLKPLLIALAAGIIAVPLPELIVNLSRWQRDSRLISFSGHSLVAQAADCIANNNLGDIADGFISRCRKGSIRQEFPGELLTETLATIKAGNSANYKKGWKLLNDGRFLK